MKFFIYFTVAVLFLTKLAINSYYKVAGTSHQVEIAMKADVAAFYASPDYRQRVKADSIRIVMIGVEFDQKRQRNQIALGQNGTLRHTTSMTALGDSIAAINARRATWVDSEINSIRSAYAKKAGSYAMQWGGIGLIYAFELMSLLFAAIAANRTTSVIISIRQHTFELKWQFLICVAASFYAEYASAEITRNALIMLLANEELAATYATAFRFLTPLVFSFAGLEIKRIDSRKAVAKPAAAPAAAHDRKFVAAATQKKNSAANAKNDDSGSNEPPDVNAAIREYVEGTLGKSQRWIARRYFGGDSHVSQVNAAIAKYKDESKNGGKSNGQLSMIEQD